MNENPFLTTINVKLILKKQNFFRFSLCFQSFGFFSCYENENFAVLKTKRAKKRQKSKIRIFGFLKKSIVRFGRQTNQTVNK